MSRRRLHGETQKRRQKPQTAKLKRSRSAHRVQATHAPAPFEQRLERQDLEFLEAMRELSVQPNWRRAMPAPRLREVERAQIEDEETAAAEFLAAMERLGVRPRASNRSVAERLPVEARGGADPSLAHSRPPPRPGHSGTSARPARTEFPGAKTQANAPGGTSPPKQFDGRFPPLDPIRFEKQGPSMAELLAGALDPARKYEGAPPARWVANPAASTRNDDPGDGEPDDTLDLHGKTQEAAIRMVQGFLLTAHQRGHRTVLIVTGRGLRSNGQGPVLREAVRAWLERDGERFVRAVRRAPGRHGGEGALWVELRRAPPKGTPSGPAGRGH
jgi:hypothetical protein